MFASITMTSLFLSIFVIVSLVTCKYMHSPNIFLLVLILASVFYQKDTNKKNNINHNIEDTLINVSKFIIITGILGYIIIRILGLFLPGLVE